MQMSVEDKTLSILSFSNAKYMSSVSSSNAAACPFDLIPMAASVQGTDARTSMDTWGALNAIAVEVADIHCLHFATSIQSTLAIDV